MTYQQAISKYGEQVCRDAFRLSEDGEGPRTIGFYCNLTTKQADCAIDAGRELARIETSNNGRGV